MASLVWPGKSGALIKVCGMRRAADIHAATDAGVDLVGLVFAPSKRRVSVEEARTLLASSPNHPPAIGVFVDEALETINLTAATAGLSAVQLSGHEAPVTASMLSVPYLKVIHLAADLSVGRAVQIMDGHRDAAAFILDSPSRLGGGSGIVADWALAAAIIRAADRPVLLAGGLSPDNVSHALRRTSAFGVDVSSGVEREGWKDAGLIAQFVDTVRSTQPARPHPATLATTRSTPQ